MLFHAGAKGYQRPPAKGSERGTQPEVLGALEALIGPGAQSGLGLVAPHLVDKVHQMLGDVQPPEGDLEVSLRPPLDGRRDVRCPHVHGHCFGGGRLLIIEALLERVHPLAAPAICHLYDDIALRFVNHHDVLVAPLQGHILDSGGPRHSLSALPKDPTHRPP